jgi:hypothetical protein
LRASVFIVDDLTTEWVTLPSLDIDRNNIGVTHQEQRWRGGIAAFDASDEIAASSYRFVRFNLDTGGTERLREHINASRFVSRFRRSVVHTSIANQVL